MLILLLPPVDAKTKAVSHSVHSSRASLWGTCHLLQLIQKGCHFGPPLTLYYFSHRFTDEASAQLNQWRIIPLADTRYTLALKRGTIYYFYITGVTNTGRTETSNYYRYDPEGRKFEILSKQSAVILFNFIYHYSFIHDNFILLILNLSSDVVIFDRADRNRV